MPIKLFQCPLPADPELPDLNSYLASNRVATVSHHLVQTAGSAMLLFVVESPKSAQSAASRPGEPPIDYRERLATEDFDLYAHLRKVRKELAEADGVPAYTILSNAEMARIAEDRPRTEAELEAIKGLGKAKVAKIAPRFLPIIASAPPRSTAPGAQAPVGEASTGIPA